MTWHFEKTNLRYAAGASVTVLAALGAFGAAATVFGGGWQGFAGAAVITVIVFLGALYYLSRAKSKTPEHEFVGSVEPSEPSGGGEPAGSGSQESSERLPGEQPSDFKATITTSSRVDFPSPKMNLSSITSLDEGSRNRVGSVMLDLMMSLGGK